MTLSMWQELSFATRRVWSELVPEPQYRKPLTWSNVPNAFAYMGPFIFMAYLVRRRDTRIIRLLLLPTVVVMAVRCTFSYDWFSPKLYLCTWLRGLIGFATVVTSIDFGLLREGRYKIEESTLPAIFDTFSSSNRDGNEVTPKWYTKFLFPWIVEALEVISALRGIGWDFGKGIYIPPDVRPLNDRDTFLKLTAKEFLRTYLIVDLIDLLLKLTPGVGSTAGGSIFFSDLPFVPRYIVSTVLATATGTLMICGLKSLYAVTTVVAVGLLGQSPAAWPPLMQNPWAADSLRDLWGRRWHQSLKRTFLVLGGIPGEWIAGRTGAILGTFLASGMFHECAMYLMGRGFDRRVTVFFMIQGVLVILESTFRAATGRRVRGTWGRIWTYVNMLVWSQLCVDAWYLRGLGGSIVVPKWISPTRLVLMPLLRRLLSSFSN